MVIASYLTAEELAASAQAGNRELNEACGDEALWKDRLQRDFNDYDKIKGHRSKGYYRKRYLSLIEERMFEHSLVCGGH